jgi:hypothetical protein
MCLSFTDMRPEQWSWRRSLKPWWLWRRYAANLLQVGKAHCREGRDKGAVGATIGMVDQLAAITSLVFLVPADNNHLQSRGYDYFYTTMVVRSRGEVKRNDKSAAEQMQCFSRAFSCSYHVYPEWRMQYNIL